MSERNSHGERRQVANADQLRKRRQYQQQVWNTRRQDRGPEGPKPSETDVGATQPLVDGTSDKA